MTTETRDQQFLPGQLVRARGRDWIVLPPAEPEVLRLRPVDGTEEELAGIFLPLEGRDVTGATYERPNPKRPGDHTSALLLRDAIRLTLRSGAGPFRSLGRLSVTPRPYQFVPLIMALRLDPVRLLIADDVGVGKTVEAAMVARELLDRGMAKRMAVLCPPHLCDQWEAELRDKFGIEAAVVQPSRIARLERELPRSDINLFQHYRYLVASIDFLKSDRYRGTFLDNAPDLVIVDEAHTATRPRGDGSGVQQQRYQLLRDLAKDEKRHLLLVTATPHSGIEENFRSLLGLLDPEFDQPPEVEVQREQLLPHVIQRRRRDLEHWLGTETPFPERMATERQYRMSPAYVRLFEDVLRYCRETVGGQGLRRNQQRVRYWAAISLLRCVLSSPKAAEAVLSKRESGLAQAALEEEDDPDVRFAPQVLDMTGDEEQPPDYAPTAPVDESLATLEPGDRGRLSRFLSSARQLAGPKEDLKLAEAIAVARELLADGHSPIVYCRFIATAEYVAEQLQSHLGKEFSALRVEAVTGRLGDEQRKLRVDQLAENAPRVLVATDCLSEGINLQEHFDAVVHYDLPWNPNRLEQREGRVDRYGQRRPVVRTVMLYGVDNQMDLVVLDVLIRKARTIRDRLGITVPVSIESEEVVQAVVDSVLLRGPARAQQLQLGLVQPEVSAFHEEWDRAAAREERQRAFFAQHQIQPDEVARELRELEPVLGSAGDVRDFLANALDRLGGGLKETTTAGVFTLDPGELTPRVIERSLSGRLPLDVSFDGIASGTVVLGRNHPLVETVADAVLGRALLGEDPFFARCGAAFTKNVSTRTAVLILRLRYLLEEETLQFAEEVVCPAFRRGADGGIEWLEPLGEEGLRLLREASPAANMSLEERTRQVEWALGMLQGDWYETPLRAREGALSESHRRLRKMVRAPRLRVEAHRPPDIMGCYVLVPAGG